MKQFLKHLQACRVNLAFPELVCDHMMNKALNDINCGDVSSRQESLMSAQDIFTNITTTFFTNSNDTVETDDWNKETLFNSTNHDFEMEVCRAERESQKLGSTISGYIAPFGISVYIFTMTTV